MSTRALLTVLFVLLLGSGAALAESDPATVEPTAAENPLEQDDSSLFAPVFLQQQVPGQDPVNVCKEAERDICNCNTDADCDDRCGEGQCTCLIALDCSEYPCVGSCRRVNSIPAEPQSGS